MGDDDSAFAPLGLSRWLCKQTAKLGLRAPTPIQSACIPQILAGSDCLGAAKTGSGKTFAFALPILQRLSADPVSHFALVLTPTHELAYQISEQFSVAGASMGVRVCTVAGGTDQMLESQRLQQRPHIVVAMPGRLADHLTGCDTFSFGQLRYLVVDEADRMLDGSFDEALAVIQRCLPAKRQNLFFSATMKEFMRESSVFPIAADAFAWSEQSEVATVETLDQRYILCAEYDRDQVLIEALRKYREDNELASVMIFTNTKKCCQLLSMTLNAVGLTNVCLHGFMRQKERVAALSRFKSNHVRTIIATDVAARGLDIPNVQLVLNHRLPQQPNEYIHRVGRTARAGRQGLAISIFRFPRDLEFLSAIETAIGTKLTEHPIDQRLVERIFMQVSVSKREAEMELDNKDYDERSNNYRRKKWIEDGLDPDVMEDKFKKQQKDKERQRKETHRQSVVQRKAAAETRTANAKQSKQAALAAQDDRFKQLDAERFTKKGKPTAQSSAGKEKKTPLPAGLKIKASKPKVLAAKEATKAKAGKSKKK